MSFPSDSPFYQKPERLRVSELVPVRHVGQANIVEVPVSVLEDWLSDLEHMTRVAPGPDDLPRLEQIADQMRSYFRG